MPGGGSKNGFLADAHDAGLFVGEWRKGFPADAHDAGFLAGDEKRVSS